MPMNDTHLKEINAARPSNIARVIFSLIFLTVYLIFNYPILLYFCIINFIISIAWFWLIESKFYLYKKNPSLWYIPASVDIFFITVCVYFSGISFSPALLAYVYSTATSSVDLIKERGLFATFGNCISFSTILTLTKLGILPYINIVNPAISEITMFAAILSIILLIVACITANSVIYQIYSQLNSKNNELNESLDKIVLLKLQQDADYALAVRLMEPLGGNYLKSDKIDCEFLLKQKKNFSFKDNNLEIGGDILIADELYFKKKKFALLINGDAMGKSLQGACGALVLGVITKSILSRRHLQSSDNTILPQEWLLNTVTEINTIFQSFDGSMLVSFFIGLLEEDTGNLYYIGMEHPAPILYRDEQTTFLETNTSYSKIGTLGTTTDFKEVQFLKLKENDILFVGSDGKDDIILKATSTRTRTINQDEFLFSKIIKKTKGNIAEILKELKEYGELSDDLSLLKISFK